MSALPAMLAAFAVLSPQEAVVRPRTEIALVVVTMDTLRQGQERYGRNMLDRLGDAWRGRLSFTAAPVAPETFGSCVDDRADARLDYCIRFYLTRAGTPATPPVVVVVLDDQPSDRRLDRPGEMRVRCFGHGVAPTDAVAQTTSLWPGAARMHGVGDLNRDTDALAACINAAAAEPFTGLRQPDPSD